MIPEGGSFDPHDPPWIRPCYIAILEDNTYSMHTFLVAISQKDQKFEAIEEAIYSQHYNVAIHIYICSVRTLLSRLIVTRKTC